MVINLTPAEVAAKLAKDEIILVDVREPQEYVAARIEGAQFFPLSDFDPARLPRTTPGRPIVFMCHVGGRSARVAEMCQQAGLPHQHHLQGGIVAWHAAGLPLVAGALE